MKIKLFKLFKKPKNIQPLPEFPPISVDQVPAASTLLFYGGTKITELAGNRLYNHPYQPPAYHAAFYIDNGLLLNVGAHKVIMDIMTTFRSTRRVDVIIYKNISDETRKMLCRLAHLDTTKTKVVNLPDYDWTSFLRFGLRLFKNSSKKDFCSDNVVDLFKAGMVKVSDLPDEQTAPWDLLEYALAHPEECDIRTLHVGADFKA